MTALRSGQSTSPRLTWYGPDSERVELSGRVLDNWVAKTVQPAPGRTRRRAGTRLRLDLPAHWKSVILALAAWQLGMEVVFDDAAAELLATANPGAGHGRGRIRRRPRGGAARAGHAVAGRAALRRRRLCRRGALARRRLHAARGPGGVQARGADRRRRSAHARRAAGRLRGSPRRRPAAAGSGRRRPGSAPWPRRWGPGRAAVRWCWCIPRSR